jgi:hypothetical protein
MAEVSPHKYHKSWFFMLQSLDQVIERTVTRRMDLARVTREEGPPRL